MKVEQNITRLNYLLSLYQMARGELLEILNEKQTKLTEDDVFSVEIDIRTLKRIDKVFNKGLSYYQDTTDPKPTTEASIFFRKQNFDTDLNIGTRKIVNKFEEAKLSLSALSKLAEINFERSLPIFSVKNDPKEVAQSLIGNLYPIFNSDLKMFLTAFISKLAQNNILVFEFVETWNKKEKSNIDGFFLTPNVIVLKRHQTSFRREIFTLAHELGHYLLNEEEIEELEVQNLANLNLSLVERWCNDFAYYFLIGKYASTIEELCKADSSNDYHFDIIKVVSQQTHLSEIALFTRMLFYRKLSQADYNKIKTNKDEDFRRRQEALRKQKEISKQMGEKQKGSAPKPIISPLLLSTIQTAFHSGLINEYEMSKALNVHPHRLDAYL